MAIYVPCFLSPHGLSMSHTGAAAKQQNKSTGLVPWGRGRNRETRARRRRRSPRPGACASHFRAQKRRRNRLQTAASRPRLAREPIASSQAPRAEERLAAVLQPPEQRHRLGLVELSRLSTSTPIGAVVVEVQTEEELAIPVNETAKNTAEPTPPPARATKKIRALGAREPGGGKRL